MEENRVKLALATVGIALALTVKKRQKQKKKRNCWVRPWLGRRGEGKDGFSLLMELREEDPSDFHNFVRMDSRCFDKVLNFIEDKIIKQDTVMREAISPSRRLAFTLRFLATGESFKSLAFSHRVSVPTISNAVVEVCEAILETMQEIYLKAPTTEHEWEKIAQEFEDLWEFPNCLGSLDGKHIRFSPPASDGSYFFNYKAYHSIVLLAIVDARYKFSVVDIGCNGRISDGGVFRNSKISSAIEYNQLHFPSVKYLKGSSLSVPFVFVADDAFRLQRNVMKPYKDCGNETRKRVFNYRLSRARRTVENAFGILANKFRILLHTIHLPVNKVELITKTLCVLHNFLIEEKDGMYTQKVDVENTDLCQLENGAWRADSGLPTICQQGGNRTSQNARDIRDKYCEYFNTCGYVPWQWEAVKKFNF